MLKSPVLLIYSLVKAVLLRIQKKKTEITLSVNIISSFSFLLSSLRLRQVLSLYSDWLQIRSASSHLGARFTRMSHHCYLHRFFFFLIFDIKIKL